MGAPLDPRRRAALGLPGRGSRPPDPRNIVTPDAFEVDASLLGLPLAGHPQRLGAILVDVVVVALVSQAGGLLLGILAAAFFLRIALPRIPDRAVDVAPTRAPDVPSEDRIPGARVFRAAFGCMGAVVLFVTVVAAWGLLSSGAPSSPSTPAPEVIRPDVVPPSGGAEGGALATEPAGGGLVLGFLRDIAEDLGVGFGWGALYFSAFLAWGKGQTPGKRLLRLRVVRLDRDPISLWAAFERYGGYAAGFATGLLGFAQVFWDPNRQAIHDKITGTVVIQDGAAPLPEPTRRLRSRTDTPDRSPAKGS
jgi:uncharacterized RDD family membrane protein YckC